MRFELVREHAGGPILLPEEQHEDRTAHGEQAQPRQHHGHRQADRARSGDRLLGSRQLAVAAIADAVEDAALLDLGCDDLQSPGPA